MSNERTEGVWIGFTLGELCAQLATLGQYWGLITTNNSTYLQRTSNGEMIDQIEISTNWTQHEVVNLATMLLQIAINDRD